MNHGPNLVCSTSGMPWNVLFEVHRRAGWAGQHTAMKALMLVSSEEIDSDRAHLQALFWTISSSFENVLP